MRRKIELTRRYDGRGGTPRRGSALIIVIGTLALISVFAAIYIAIGRADTRAADTVRVRAKQADYADAYASHVAGVIGRDRLDATLQYADANLTYQVPRRESTDAPYTDWSVRSESDTPAEWFFPWGGNPYPRPTADRFDPRVQSDPWLASLRPTYLGPPAGSLGAYPISLSDPFRRFMDDRDWYQISNFAPDGRFVNLFNLRPQASPFGGTAIGGFDSEPGWGSTNNPDGRQVRRMSEGLSLFRLVNPNDPRSPVRSFDPTADGIWLPGQSAPFMPPGLSADDIRNTPAVWSMYQRYGIIPLDQAFVTYNRDGDVSDWGDPDYPAYQWGDADGDKIADGRWIELTEARETRSGSGGPREDIQTLYPGGDMRVFGVIRAVDLSGMVNVNTAGDSLTPPTEEHPMGLTPTEIDLRRLLTRQDISANNQSGRAVVGNREPYPLSFADLGRDRRGVDQSATAAVWPESDYTRYTADLVNRTVSAGFLPGTPLDPGDPGQNGFPNGPNANQPIFSNGLVIGRYAAAAIRRSIELNAPLPRGYRGALSIPPVDPTDPLHLTEGSSFDGASISGFNELGEAKADAYRKVGAINPLRLGEAIGLTSSGGPGPAANASGAGLFGLDDLAELLTFHGLNDPEVTSRLEIAAGGRFQFQGGTGDERYSPLLSTRPLTLDRDAHGAIPVNRFNPNRGTEITGEISEETMALLALSPRSRLSTITGAVKLRPGVVVGNAYRGNNESVAQKLSSLDAAVPISALGESGEEAFSVYYGALAGELESFRPKRGGAVDGLPAGILNNVWSADLSLSRDSPYATLFYGHRGPELALRVAAHAGVNAKDMFDSDSRPTIATMVLDNAPAVRNLVDNIRTQIQNLDDIRDFNLANSVEALLYPGFLDSFLDPDAGPQAVNDTVRQVLPTNVLPDGRRLVNVFGIEPTPIITEVAAFTVYTDASSATGAGGDDDDGPAPRPSPRPGLRPILEGDSLTQITIDPTVDAGNTDLMTQVIAIQLTNPWDEDILLGGGSGPGGIMWRAGENARDRFDADNNLEFNYYIEYNGRFFKLGEFREYLPPRSNGGIDYRANDEYAMGGGPTVDPIGQEIPLASTDDSYVELEYRNVVLGAGQSRVFYITSHTRLYSDSSSPGGLDERWASLIWPDGSIDQEYTNLSIANPNDNDVDADGKADGYDAKGWTGPAQEWIERRQFRSPGGEMAFPARIHPFDPRTGELVEGKSTVVDPSDFVDFIGDAGDPGSDFGLTDRTAKAGLVRLWRKHAVAGIEEVPDRIRNRAGQIRENLVQNDILVDRMYLGATDSDNYLATAQWSNANTNFEITNSVSFPESFDTVNDPCNASNDVLNIRNDNTGITFARWASARRKDTARTLSGNAETGPEENVGKIDAYLLASRRDPMSLIERIDNSSIVVDSPDIRDFLELCDPSDPLNGYNGVVGMLGTVEYDAERRLQPFWTKGMNQLPVVQTVATHPRLKNDTDPGPSLASDQPLGRFDADPLADNATGRNLFDDNADELRPEVFLSKDLDAARVTDTLLALGIGPAYAPNLSANSRDPRSNYEVYDDEWMTLSEAFAIALGFENFTAANTLTDVNPDVVWFDAARTVAGGDPEYVLEDLRLRFDDYVPFLNIQRAAEVGPNEKPAFTGNFPNAANSDVRRGAGVPAALGVLDAVTAIDPPRYPGEDDLDSDEEEAWRLTSPVMGQINVNTAPLDVLRTLPGLTPSAELYRTRLNPAFNTEWWGANAFGGVYQGIVTTDRDKLGVPDLEWISDLNAVNNPDVAATLEAYRDRKVARIRARSDPNILSPGTGLELSYTPALNVPGISQMFLDNLYTEIPITPGQDVSLPRNQLSGVEGLRGAPGFGSLGEVLMASIDTESLQTDFPDIAALSHLSVDYYARDDANLGVSGSGEDAVSLSPQFTDGRAGNVEDDYAERLAMAAGVMNLTTTRSDFYAVWMLLHGYRESDVATLGENDPLVPSFQKRYLMVIDRSNVVEPGDQPRVVLFREVPF